MFDIDGASVLIEEPGCQDSKPTLNGLRLLDRYLHDANYVIHCIHPIQKAMLTIGISPWQLA